jgi:hypothetical protein
MAVTTKKTNLPLQATTQYDEYLEMPPAPNVETIVPLNLSNAMSAGKGTDKGTGIPRDRSWNPDAQAPSPYPQSTQPADTSNKSGSSGRFSAFSYSTRGRRRHTGGSCVQQQAAADIQGGELDGEAQGADTVRVQVAGTGRHVKARMWLARDAPINQKQLLPLLDVIGSTNQYISKVCQPVSLLGNV